MKLHWMGKYNNDPASLPAGEHEPGAVCFKEPKSMKALSLLANGICIALFLLLAAGLALRWGLRLVEGYGVLLIALGAVLALLGMFPHELLHAVCFKKDVHLYTNLKQGLLFVVGTERMSRARFIFMSLLPNLVLGAVPYCVAMALPSPLLGSLGAILLASGAGDYINVFNALTQMPKKARTYMHGMHSYWYIPG